MPAGAPAPSAGFLPYGITPLKRWAWRRASPGAGMAAKGTSPSRHLGQGDRNKNQLRSGSGAGLPLNAPYSFWIETRLKGKPRRCAAALPPLTREARSTARYLKHCRAARQRGATPHGGGSIFDCSETGGSPPLFVRYYSPSLACTSSRSISPMGILLDGSSKSYLNSSKSRL
jgi:hypothetical protein